MKDYNLLNDKIPFSDDFHSLLRLTRMLNLIFSKQKLFILRMENMISQLRRIKLYVCVNLNVKDVTSLTFGNAFALTSPLLFAQIESTDRHKDKLSKSRRELELQVLHIDSSEDRANISKLSTKK